MKAKDLTLEEKFKLLTGKNSWETEDLGKKIKITLRRSAFSYYNPSAEDYLVESGTFEILVGASSQDIRLSGKVDIKLSEFDRYAVVFERN